MNDGLRFPLPWLLFGLGLLGLVAWLSLGGIFVLSPRYDKYGHLFAYALLMFWFGQLLRSHWHRLMLFLFLLVLGALLELLQKQGGIHRFDYADMVANGVGAFCGWLLLVTPLGKSLAGLERLLFPPR